MTYIVTWSKTHENLLEIETVYYINIYISSVRNTLMDI